MPDLLARLEAALADRYRVEREIGRGGMAHVFLAHDLKLDRPVAVKVLRPDLAAVLGGERFLREIELAAKLTHPHIVPIYDRGRTDGPTDRRADEPAESPAAQPSSRPADFLYYVMPYIEGESLRDRLTREKQLPVDDALQIAREVADALSYAHSRGVIHRDIKPENILLESGHAVVADFGIARAIDAAGGDKLTETGVTLGTPAYMSPEQAGGSRELDGRSDLYSLGCVLYEMLAGQPPFTGPTVESLVHQHLAAEPPSITNIRPSVPSWVVSALQRAVAKTPADRFNPVAQFGEAIAPRVSVSEAPLAAPRAVAAAARRGWRWIVVAAVAVIAVAGGWLGWKALRSGRPGPELAGPRPYTIVADVDGTADVEVRQTVRAILAAALDQSHIVQALPEDQIGRGLALAGKPDTTTLNLTVARELAERGSIRTVVAGSLERAGETYHLTVRVVDADSGTVLAAERAEARGDDDLIPAVDGLMRALRERLGERPDVIAPTRPAGEVATPSLAAYRLFVRGAALGRAGDWIGSARAYEQAITLDPGFAQAWLALAGSYGNTGDPARAVAAVDSALAHADRLHDASRLVAQARRASAVSDYEAVAEICQRLIDLYGPNEFRLGMLVVALEGMGRVQEALRASEQLLRLPAPFGFQAVVYGNYAQALASLGRFDEAWETAKHLTGQYATAVGERIAASAADWVKAESLATGLHESSSAARRAAARRILASVQASRGQVRGAMTRLQEVADDDSTALRARARRAHWAMLVLGVVSGTPLDSRALRTVPTDTAPGAVLAALWAVVVGDTAGARVGLTAVRALPLERRRNLDAALLLGDAWLAAAAGRYVTAVALLRSAAPRAAGSGEDVLVRQLVPWTVGEAFEREQQPDSAAAWFERIARWDETLALERDERGLTYSFVHFKLGGLYAQLNRYDEAKEHYATFLETFTKPDPEYAWMVTEARAKLEELARGR